MKVGHNTMAIPAGDIKYLSLHLLCIKNTVLYYYHISSINTSELSENMRFYLNTSAFFLVPKDEIY